MELLHKNVYQFIFLSVLLYFVWITCYQNVHTIFQFYSKQFLPLLNDNNTFIIHCTSSIIIWHSQQFSKLHYKVKTCLCSTRNGNIFLIFSITFSSQSFHTFFFTAPVKMSACIFSCATTKPSLWQPFSVRQGIEYQFTSSF